MHLFSAHYSDMILVIIYHCNSKPGMEFKPPRLVRLSLILPKNIFTTSCLFKVHCRICQYQMPVCFSKNGSLFVTNTDKSNLFFGKHDTACSVSQFASESFLTAFKLKIMAINKI